MFTGTLTLASPSRSPCRDFFNIQYLNFKHLKNQHGFLIGLTLSAFLIFALVFTSCQKGNQGAAGAPGTAGANGTPGASGNTILSGDGITSLTMGNNGDYYLELDSSNLYGPKTSAGWGSPFSMTGAPGAAGASGD